MPVAGEVAIIGLGCSKFGENFDKSYFDMMVEAGFEAFADANVEPSDIQGAWLGTAFAFTYHVEGNAGTSVAEPLRLRDIPITRVSNYCATGMDAVRNAANAVAAGECDVALAIGVEKMRDVPPRGSLVAQAYQFGHPLYAKGRTAPGNFALLARRYAHMYNVDIKKYMAKVAVKNHYNGSMSPKAHFQRPITEEQALKAPMIVDPIGLFDACPTTDGCAAVILTKTSLAKQFTNEYVVIKGIGLSVSQGYFGAQFEPDWDFLGFRANQQAAIKAYKQAGITNPRKQIDLAEVHDCFTVTEMIDYEDLFFCERGQAWKMVEDGVTNLDGAFPVNTSGGLKSYGHPIGASGIRMIVNISEQLLGRAGKRQLKNPKVGLAHNLGGPGAVGIVTVVGLPGA